MKRFCDGRQAGKSLGIYKMIVDILEHGVEDYVYIASENIDKTLKTINSMSDKEIVSEVMNENRKVYKLKYK